MNIDAVRNACLTLPGVTESVQWGDNLVFKVAGKIFAIANLEPDDVALCFKCTPEEFSELSERPGCRPAPYLARAQWIALESFDALPQREILRLIRLAYDLVVAKLPKKALAGLALPEDSPRRQNAGRPPARRKS
jgi:predicted DNA-binding protein (MmcQ/YjbR family)